MPKKIHIFGMSRICIMDRSKELSKISRTINENYKDKRGEYIEVKKFLDKKKIENMQYMFFIKNREEIIKFLTMRYNGNSVHDIILKNNRLIESIDEFRLDIKYKTSISTKSIAVRKLLKSIKNDNN